MSQEKVAARKEYKKNRKKIIAQEKRRNQFMKLIAYLVVLAIVIGIGWSVYNKVKPQPQYDISSFYKLIDRDNYGFLTPVLDD